MSEVNDKAVRANLRGAYLYAVRQYCGNTHTIQDDDFLDVIDERLRQLQERSKLEKNSVNAVEDAIETDQRRYGIVPNGILAIKVDHPEAMIPIELPSDR